MPASTLTPFFDAASAGDFQLRENLRNGLRIPRRRRPRVKRRQTMSVAQRSDIPRVLERMLREEGRQLRLQVYTAGTFF